MTKSFCRVSLSMILIVAWTMILAGVGGEAAYAKPVKTPPLGVGTCLEHGGATSQPEGSAIRTCCMDGMVQKGCWICDYKWENCTWDPGRDDPSQEDLRTGGKRNRFRDVRPPGATVRSPGG